MIVGIGGVYLNADLGFVAMIEQTRGVRGYKKTLHRATMTFLKSVKEAGIGPIHAIPDRNIKGASRYLERIGFMKSDHDYKGQQVYIWQ